MKQNKFFILAAALAFVACSSDDNYTAKEKASQAPQEVSFSAYVNRGVTRAGQTGLIVKPDATTTGTYEIKLNQFGVFAFYTNADDYDNLSSMPNFMYNEKITYDVSDSKWSYAPIKYWPNEFGANAYSEDIDKVSFFAYAPYVEVKPETGKLKTISDGNDTWGIVGMKRNNESGDPMIKYIASFYTDQQVDLLWGTTGASDIDWNLKNSSGSSTSTQKIDKNLPWLNVEHPNATSKDWTNAQKVKFQFEHALAELNIQVDTYADVSTPATASTAANPAENTKVYIRSVTFEGFDTQGALNLNNEVEKKPLWCDFECLCPQNGGNEVTIRDGRKDGIEGLTAASKENAMINPAFVQSMVWGDGAPEGVTATARNLFRLKTAVSSSFMPAADAPIFVIPNDDPLKVTIEYDVLTKDDKLVGKLNDGTTHGSVVKNVISRYITFGNSEVGSTTSGTKLENGKKYTIKLHLGLNSVQFDADVTDWGTDAGGANLPHNN